VPGLEVASIARVPRTGVEAVRDHEAAVLPALADYGAPRDRRLPREDGDVELHVVRFASRLAVDRFRADPCRQAVAPRLRQSQAANEPMELQDVD